MTKSAKGQQQPLVAAALSRTRGAFTGVAFVSAVTNLLMLTGPLFMLQIYDRVLSSRSVPTLVALTALVAGLYLFLGVLEIIRARVLTRIGQRVDRELSGPAFDAGLNLPLKTRNSEAAAHPMRDLDRIRQFMAGQGPVAICDLPWLPIYLAIIFMFHPYLGWLGTAGAVILIVITLINEYTLRKPVERLAAMTRTRNAFAEAGRRNAEVLRAMGMGPRYRRRFEVTDAPYQAIQARVGDMTGSFSAGTKVFRLGLQSAVLALGAWLAIMQAITPGVMIAASILTARALAPIEAAIGQWRHFIACRQAHRRLGEMLGHGLAADPDMVLPRPASRLDVENIAVAAPGDKHALIQDLRFSLKAGDALGVIGPSGSGKSTLARALVGIWPAMRGTIRLDGATLDQWAPEALGPAIGYLPQGVELFDGTVAENIARFDPDADPQAIVAAAERAGVHELILQFPDGYDTRIGEYGAILSVGQRQRIGLARALYGQPFLIVLDEPNANLDAEGEKALSEAIAAARADEAIVVVIAHRPSALANVDQVLVMQGGRQAAIGPRDEVLRRTTIRPVPATA